MSFLLAAAIFWSIPTRAATLRTGAVESGPVSGIGAPAGFDPRLSLQLPALSGPAPGLSSVLPSQLALIREFREKAGLPALAPATVAALSRSPETALQAQAQAAKAFLGKVNPAFDATISQESALFDPPVILEYKKLIAAARKTLAEAGVAAVSEKIKTSSLERVYTGDPRVLDLARRLPGPEGAVIADLIQDGAPKAALARLAKSSPRHELARKLKDVPEASSIKRLARLKETAESLFRQGRYGDALASVKSLAAAVLDSGLREGSRRDFWLEAAGLEQKIKDKGAAALYGAGGKLSAAKLAARVGGLLKRDPGAYVGDPIAPRPTRLQCYGDCAIQQLYNHPRLAPAAEQLPYSSFLNAVEGKLGEGTRREGLMDMESGSILRELGLARVRQGAPKNAEEAAALLKTHGAMLLTVRWEKAKDFKERGGNHAVLVQGAFRENGDWTFVVIDSNHSRPQLHTFDELRVFGARSFDSVEVLPSGHRMLSPELRTIADPAARLRKGVNLFYARHGAVLSRVAWHKKILFWPVNFIREKLGWDALEPAPYETRDPNLIPLGKIPAKISRALRSGVKFPPETLVTGPDGRRYLNLHAAERVLAAR